ncbi:MAG: hypothetical protein IPM54_17580 [Polyangiaceae bacterium]|nr:hypothetical protein [Polyangiaceae bacterium]
MATEIEIALDQLPTTANAYSRAGQAYLEAFADEGALGGEHYHAVDKLMGLVRAVFPETTACDRIGVPGDGRR